MSGRGGAGSTWKVVTEWYDPDDLMSSADAVHAHYTGTARGNVQLTIGHGCRPVETVFFRGWTNGCFDCSSPFPAWTEEAPQNWDLLWGTTGRLRYVNSTFSGTTSMGSLHIGDDAVDQPNGAVINVDNFGAFYLDYDPLEFSFETRTFTLFINFLDPIRHEELLTAALSGAVEASAGGVYINFDNVPVWFGGDQYSVQVNDINLSAPTLYGRTQLSISGVVALAQDTP
jgi:hypothetical protein